jgi:trigger factor
MQSQETESTVTSPDIPYTIISDEMRPQSFGAITVEVPYAPVEKELNRGFADMRKNVALPGFRKGKAPEGLLRRRYGREVEREAVQNVAAKVYDKVQEQLGFTRLTDAEMESYHIKEGEKVSIDYLVEVYPTVTIEGFEGNTLEVPWDEPKAPDFDRYLSEMSRRWGTNEPKEGGIELGDRAKLVIKMEAEGHEPHEDSRDFDIKQGELPEDVLNALLGKAAGETVEVNRSHEHPAEHEGEAPHVHRERWVITIESVSRVIPADINDEFVKENFGIDTLDAYRQKLLERHQRDQDSELFSAKLTAILRKIAADTKFDVPPTIAIKHTREVAARDAKRMESYGVDVAELYKRNKGYVENIRNQGTYSARIEIILEALAKQLGFTVTDEEVDAELNRLAEDAGRKPLAIRAQLERNKTWDLFRNSVLVEKVKKHLVAMNAFTLVPREEYYKKMEKQAEAESSKGSEGDGGEPRES